MITVPKEEFDALRANLPVATAEGLFETYRISQTTWYKLRDGEPVKVATVERLRSRFRQLTDGAAAGAARAS